MIQLLPPEPKPTDLDMAQRLSDHGSFERQPFLLRGTLMLNVMVRKPIGLTSSQMDVRARAVDATQARMINNRWLGLHRSIGAAETIGIGCDRSPEAAKPVRRRRAQPNQPLTEEQKAAMRRRNSDGWTGQRDIGPNISGLNDLPPFGS